MIRDLFGDERLLIGTRYPKGGLTRCNREGRNWICTRGYGHDGPHVAHGPDSEAYGIWDDDRPTLDAEATTDALKILCYARTQSAHAQVAWDYLQHAIKRLDAELTAYLRTQE